MALMEAKVSHGNPASSAGDALGGGAADGRAASGLNRVREKDDLGEKERCLLFAWTLKGERRIISARVLSLSPCRLAWDLEVQVHCSSVVFFLAF